MRGPANQIYLQYPAVCFYYLNPRRRFPNLAGETKKKQFGITPSHSIHRYPVHLLTLALNYLFVPNPWLRQADRSERL